MGTGRYKHPAFFSYSRADESAWGNWCKDFHTVFCNAIAGELRNRGFDPARPFFDIEDLAGKNETVERNLRDGVSSSFALFIFLGPGYVNSQWCCEELRYFASMHRGAQDTLLERVWVFELAVLDTDVRARFKQRLAEADAKVLESQLRSAFLEPGTNKRPVLIREDMSFNQAAFQKTVEPIVKELVNRLDEDAGTPPALPVPPDPRMDVDVLIALPTPDLADSCDRLEAALVAETHSVRRVARNDLDDLSDADLQRLFATARIVVVPVSEAKLLMQRLPGGHLKLQADALPQGEAKRALYWRPAAGRVLDEGAAEADPKHLAALTELLRRAGPAASVDDVAEEIGRRLARPAQPADGSEIVILVEENDDAPDSPKDDVVDDLSKKWQALSPLPGVQCQFQWLNLATLSRKPRPVPGDAVVVFPDPDEEMMQSKCNLISRNMQRWQKARTPLRPGLIVETDHQEAEFVVTWWPTARFSLAPEGEPPRPRGFGDESKGNLKRFFNQIGQFRAALAKAP